MYEILGKIILIICYGTAIIISYKLYKIFKKE